MSYQHACAQCDRPFFARRPDAETCSEECKYQRWIERQLPAPQPVGSHPLQAVREERAAQKHNRDLGGLIRQAIVDRLKTIGECSPEDLIPLYPQGEIDLCRRLATAQFGSLASSRDGKEPLIREKERRKSTIPARKGAKVTVWEFTVAGRRHYGMGIAGVGAGSDGPGGTSADPGGPLTPDTGASPSRPADPEGAPQGSPALSGSAELLPRPSMLDPDVEWGSAA